METEVKRGRGRPRKVVSPEEMNKPKLPRGRPRKYPKVEKTEKRPRGRPRTRPIIAPEDKRPRGRPRKYEALAKLEKEKIAQMKDEDNFTMQDYADSGIDFCDVDFDSIALAEDFQNEQFKEVSEKDVIAKVEKEVQKDLKNEQIAREKSSAYVKLKKESKRIVKNGNTQTLYPAKHYKSNILEQVAEKDETPRPEVKLNISKSKTPLRELIENKPTRATKTKPMNEKVIVVTGATSGMGYDVALEFARLGHIVVGVGRKATACRDALKSIKQAVPDAKISFVVTDLSLISQVSVLAEDIADKIYNFKRSCIDVIINCAHTRLEELQLTYENREVMWTTNYLAFVMLVDCLMPLIDRSVDARVITFSDSKSFTKTKLDWQGFHAKSDKNVTKIYEQTRLANLMWAMEFDHRNSLNTTLHAYCVQGELSLNNTVVKGLFGKMKAKMFGSKFTEQDYIAERNTVIYLALSKDLPLNMVCYKDSQPSYPLNRFALDQDNRNALWRMTELELRIK